MEHSKFTNNAALLEFLNQNGIPAIPSAIANPGMLHWWEFEKIERIADVAIFEGYFFLAVTNQGFSLHVFNAESDWYNYVRMWETSVSEDVFLQDLKGIVFSDDIYSFDSYVWSCVSETYFDFAWKRTIRDIQHGEQLSSELKPKIFNLQQTVEKTPYIRDFVQATIDLLDLFTRENVRNPVNCLIMWRYFPPAKYEQWPLPAECKLLLNNLGKVFDQGHMPTMKEVGNLVQKAHDLLDEHNSVA